MMNKPACSRDAATGIMETAGPMLDLVRAAGEAHWALLGLGRRMVGAQHMIQVHLQMIKSAAEDRNLSLIATTCKAAIGRKDLQLLEAHLLQQARLHLLQHL